MNVMNCRELSESLSLLAAGALPADERESVQRHIAGCPDCARQLEQAKRICNALRAAAQVSPVAPERFTSAAFQARFESSLQAEINRARIIRLVWRVVVPLSAAALFALLFRPSSQPTVPILQPGPAVASVTTPPPTLAAFRRALSVSPEAVEALLDAESREREPQPALSLSMNL
jgi:anti-sigma factor RsiW